MSWSLDLEHLAKLFTRRGERVVIVLPEGEPIVLLPLAEYEKFIAPRGQRPVVEPSPRRTNEKQPQSNRSAAPTAPPTALEQVDPPQGGLKDDDQYYPEPLGE